MKIIEKFPYEVEIIPHLEIGMPDGARLAARLWLPKGAENAPAPAVLEYIPYRKNDHTAPRDASIHHYFAGHGYASLRVDIRGSGDSQGVLADEYQQSELDDGVSVINWIASQPWCDGNVGMIGISWGGFNGLQIAAMRPSPLKAVISVCATDDRYADDVHYMGGCLLGDNVSWASQMFAYNALPPDPESVGDKWRKMWFERLNANEPWLLKWLEHQHRDDYWRHGSICEDWGAVQTPVMIVSGWADGYSNAVFRILEKLQAPCRGLVGPWSHKYPHLGIPGPAIGFLQECLRWWGQWLRGEETGVMQEPAIRAWMQDSVSPTASYQQRPGRWVCEDEWPSPRIEMKPYILASAYRLQELEEYKGQSKNLDDKPFISVMSPLTTGLFAGKWCSYAATPDLPHDQRQEDGGALIFDSERLSEQVEIFGAPVLELDYQADQPMAIVAVRISDIQPNDKATRITYGLKNLSHLDSHSRSAPIDTGARHRVRIKLNDIAQVFPAGHRIRVAISTSYWPLAWPAPKPVKLQVYTGASRLLLPVREPRDEDSRIGFKPAEGAPPVPVEQLSVTDHGWHVMYDLAQDAQTLYVVNDNGVERIGGDGLLYIDKTEEWYSSVVDDFDSITAEVKTVRGLERNSWQPHIIARTRLTCSQSEFRLIAELDAYEGDRRVFSRNWDERVPRRSV